MKEREIKFRAIEKEWKYKSTKKPEMVYGIESCYDDNIGDCFANFLSGDHHIMQYTGLKDKNGKEIYEGDIINWPNLNSVGQVYYNQKEVVFCVKCKHDEAWLDSGCEVIGNIYENPELIK